MQVMSRNAHALKSVAKGTGSLMFTTSVGMLLQLASGVLVVRTIEKNEYGLYSLAMVIITLLSSVSNFGFNNGVPQLLSAYNAKNNYEKAWSVIYSSIVIVGLISVFASFCLFWLAEIISEKYGKTDLMPILEFFAWMLVPLALTQIIVNIFRGFSISFPKAIFQEIGTRVIRITGVIIVLYLGLGMLGILWVSVVAAYIIAFLTCYYAVTKLPTLLERSHWEWIGGDILKYSMPLFGASLVLIILQASSALLLGYFSTADQLALYSAPKPLTRALELPLLALGFFYLPIATSLYASDGEHSVKGLYHSATKWSVLACIPIFLLFLMDSEYLVRLLYGEEYRDASTVLSVLAIGSFSHVFFGPNGMMLITFNRRNTVFLSTVTAVLISILLGMALIPSMGAVGAAIAMTCALVISNLVISYSLYKAARILPMKATDFVLLTSVAVFGVLPYLLLRLLELESVVWHIFVFLITVLVCIVGPVLFKALNADDIFLLAALERKLTKSDSIARWVARRCKLDYEFC